MSEWFNREFNGFSGLRNRLNGAIDLQVKIETSEVWAVASQALPARLPKSESPDLFLKDYSSPSDSGHEPVSGMTANNDNNILTNDKSCVTV
jgi:hypothetical protein